MVDGRFIMFALIVQGSTGVLVKPDINHTLMMTNVTLLGKRTSFKIQLKTLMKCYKQLFTYLS